MNTMNDGDRCTVRFRVDGDGDQVAALMAMMRSMDHLDRVVEVGTDASHTHEDSSSAGLSDAVAGDFHDIEIHALDADAAELARDLVEVAARDLGVVVEYIDHF